MDVSQRVAQTSTTASERRRAGRLVRALSRCATEAELVQVLYAELHPALGCEGIELQVLEREGWCHSLAIERGVLRDVRRLRLADTPLAACYQEPAARV